MISCAHLFPPAPIVRALIVCFHRNNSASVYYLCQIGLFQTGFQRICRGRLIYLTVATNGDFLIWWSDYALIIIGNGWFVPVHQLQV